MAASTRSSCGPSVRPASGSRLPSGAAVPVMSTGCPSRVTERSSAGLSSTKVSPGVWAVKRITVRESKVSLPRVRSRSTVYRWTSICRARVCASSRVSTGMGSCCRTRPTTGQWPPGSALAVLGDLLVVADDLGNDEVEELLGEGGVEFGVLGELAQPFDLAGFARGVGRGQRVLGLEVADLLGAFEAFGEHMDDGGVDVVDAVAEAVELGADGRVDGRLGCGRTGSHDR